MKLLLDTHALLWWLAAEPSLSKSARLAIANTNNQILVSAASVWEISTKFRLGKLATAADLIDDLDGYLQREGFQILPITATHALRAGLLPGAHRDPFDRVLIAQALELNITLVSKEAIFSQYGVRRVW